MFSLTYFSTAVEPFTPLQLEALLASSRARNHDVGLTGMLLYVNGHFVQTLEGEQAVVWAAYERIRIDQRHRDVFISLSEEIGERSWSDWSMGFERPNSDATEAIPGFSQYLNGRSPELTPGRARVFHRVFRDEMR